MLPGSEDIRQIVSQHEPCVTVGNSVLQTKFRVMPKPGESRVTWFINTGLG